MAAPRDDDPVPVSPVALAVLLALPLVGLALLLVRPDLDLEWEHHPSHFWLVLVTAGVSVALAEVTNIAAGRHRDARLVLISLAFLSSAGFLGLHALATPGVLLSGPNAGFVVATPVGLVIASLFAVASVGPLAGPRAAIILRHRTRLVGGLVLVMAAWAVASLAGLPPLDAPPPVREAFGPLTVAAIVTVGLYAFAARRTFALWRRRGGLVLLTVAVALALLAEAMIALTVSRNWRLSWWEWHVLLLLAFAAIGLGARREYQRSGTLSGAFGGLYLDATLARVDRWHARAIAAVAAADARGESPDRVIADLRYEGASEDETRLLLQAARELRRLDEAFRPYLPGPVASRIRSDPERHPLGGEEREVSVLFADLAGFTTFSEHRSPTDVIGMLNEFWAAVVPAIDETGGVIEQFAGDGIMAIFNATGNQPDHARRAARAALATIRASRPITEAHAGWPTFRIGINTGRAVVGTVGAAGRVSFATIGDTTNTAARLMAAGDPGQIVIAAATLAGLGDPVNATSLGSIHVKGRELPVDAWLLHDGADATPAG